MKFPEELILPDQPTGQDAAIRRVISRKEREIAQRIKDYADWSMLPWWQRIRTKKPE